MSVPEDMSAMFDNVFIIHIILSVCSFLLVVLEPGVGRGPGAEAAAALQGVRHGAIHRGPGQTGQTNSSYISH